MSDAAVGALGLVGAALTLLGSGLIGAALTAWALGRRRS